MLQLRLVRWFLLPKFFPRMRRPGELNAVNCTAGGEHGVEVAAGKQVCNRQIMGWIGRGLSEPISPSQGRFRIGHVGRGFYKGKMVPPPPPRRLHRRSARQKNNGGSLSSPCPVPHNSVFLHMIYAFPEMPTLHRSPL